MSSANSGRLLTRTHSVAPHAWLKSSRRGRARPGSPGAQGGGLAEQHDAVIKHSAHVDRLVTAMREWRPERGAFPAFAQRCVKSKALLAVISASRHKHHALNLAASLEEH